MKRIYLLLFITLFTLTLSAQKATGVILDENNEPAIGANVIEKGTYNGTVTDFDGNYSLDLTTENPILVIKSLGYRTQEIAYSSTAAKIALKVDAIGVDDVVVTASKRKERLLDAPASVTTIKAEKIENTAAIVVADNLKGVPGVDIIPTGLVSQNVAVRGFNNIFSGALLTMVDNRIGRVPSLKVNAFQLLPSGNEDIKAIEVVRGPASALYGPNASDGVLHIITKSPLDLKDNSAETTLSFVGGSNSVWAPSVRHAQKIGKKFGFKVSGGYMQGHDFEQPDDREPAVGTMAQLGSVTNGTLFQADETKDPQEFKRDYFIQKYNFDTRFDFAVNKDLDFTLSGGYANTTNLELTGLGAAQGINWGYTYGQVKMRWKNLFFNYFVNASNSGDTYLIPQVGAGDPQPYPLQTLADRSMLHGLQLQHNAKIKDKFDFTYGFDFMYTLPQSDGTIYGRYEDDDNIGQYGLYLQTEWHPIKKLDILGALRVDYQDRINEVMLSPRAAIVYKPNTRNTIRATYNRAFSAPSALNTALDLPQQFIPNGITARGLGNPDGFNYNYGTDGLAQFKSPYDNQWYSVADNSSNHILFEDITQDIGKILGQSLADDAAIGQSLVTAITQGLIDDVNSPINSVDKIVTDFITGKEFKYETITDLASVKSTVTQTVELGYKGIIKDKVFLTVDAYYTQINNFVSPLSPGSYRVQFDPTQLSGAMAPAVMANLARVSTIGGFTYDELLTGSFLPNLNLDENGDGTAFEELMYLLAGNPADPTDNGYIYDFSAGTVAPDNDLVNSDLILTYINLGTVDLAGADLGIKYVEKIKETEISISGMFSFVNKDRIALEGASDGYVALNAPKYKTSLALDFANIGNSGVGAGANWRWSDAFPANSAIYVGDVSAAHLLDLNISYRPNFSKNTLISGSFYNVTDNKFQRFPGTPYIGFYAMAKLSHTFKYNVGKNKMR